MNIELKKIITVCFFSIAIFVFFPRQSSAAQLYYVSTLGSDSNTGSLTSPWKTISKAASVLKPGDTVFVRGGTYNEWVKTKNSGSQILAPTSVKITKPDSIHLDTDPTGAKPGDYAFIYSSKNGNSGAYKIVSVTNRILSVETKKLADETVNAIASIERPVIFQAYPGERPVINGMGDQYKGFKITGTSHVVIDGFEIENSGGVDIGQEYGQPLSAPSTFNLLTNNIIHHNSRTGIMLWGINNTHNIIMSNELYSNGQNGPGEAIYIGVDDNGWASETGNRPNQNNYTQIIGNYIHDSGENSIDIKASNQYTVIAGNRIVNNATSGWNGAIDIAKNCANTMIYGNSIISTTAASGNPTAAIYIYGLKPGVVGAPSSLGYFLIYNNLITGAAHAGITLTNNTQDIIITHNTITKTTTGIFSEGATGNPTITNNLFSNNKSHIFGFQNSVTNNLFDQPMTGVGTNIISGNPNFRDVAKGDYHILSGSNAIDKAINSNTQVDIDQVRRPNAIASDLGAYEFSTETTTITPTATIQYCATKIYGDSDCIANAGSAITITDFEIWRKEYFSGCRADNLQSCDPDDDGNGYLMDANFNYPGSTLASANNNVDIADFETWRKGYFSP